MVNLVEEGAEGPRGAKSAQGAQHISGACQGSIWASVTLSTRSSPSVLGLQASALVPEDKPCFDCWGGSFMPLRMPGVSKPLGGTLSMPGSVPVWGSGLANRGVGGISRVSPVCLGLQPRVWVDAWPGLKGGGAGVGLCGVGCG